MRVLQNPPWIMLIIKRWKPLGGFYVVKKHGGFLQNSLPGYCRFFLKLLIGLYFFQQHFDSSCHQRLTSRGLFTNHFKSLCLLRLVSLLRLMLLLKSLFSVLRFLFIFGLFFSSLKVFFCLPKILLIDWLVFCRPRVNQNLIYTK